MYQWLNVLKEELNKHFYPDEVDDILEYYQEIIEDRVQNGEIESEVLATLDPKSIAHDMLPEVLSKRTNVTSKERLKTTKQLWVALAQTSLKVPLTIIYTIVIVLISIIMVSIALSMVGSFIVFIYYGFDLFEAGLSNYDKLGMSGISLVLLSIIGLILVNVYRLILEIHKKILNVFSQWTKKKGDLE